MFMVKGKGGLAKRAKGGRSTGREFCPSQILKASTVGAYIRCDMREQ